MFSAEFSAIGKIWEAILTQGSLFFDTYVADINTPETKWYLFLFSAVLIYSFVEMFIKRRRRS